MGVSKEELIRLLHIDTYTWPHNRSFCLSEEGAITESNKAPTYLLLPISPPPSSFHLLLVPRLIPPSFNHLVDEC